MADLKVIRANYMQGRVATTEPAELLNLPELVGVDMRDTFFENVTKVNNISIQFRFAIRKRALDSRIYQILAFDHWSNLLDKSMRLQYHGSRFAMFNQTSHCLKHLHQPARRNIKMTCDKDYFIDNDLKQWTKMEATQNVHKYKYEPQIVTTTKFNYVDCYPGRVFISQNNNS